MPTGREHRQPEVPKAVQEAERVAKQMYASLKQAKAPKASCAGYVMGACAVVKMMIDQASQQGSDKDALKTWAIGFIQGI